MSIKDLASAVNAVLPQQLGEDLRKNVRSVVRSGFENMELVSREELEVQEQVLLKTRKKLEQLQEHVVLLEARLDALESINP
jgi:ubiquinone biosynthesis accessory factor UbiK